MVFIDGAAITLALPEMQTSFGADATATAWVVEGYGLALGALLLFGGALGDKIGRRSTFAAGIILFAIASIACAFAPSIGAMNAARVLQGIGGMLLAPASLAILGAHFSGTARGRAIAAWSAFGALTSSIGPAVGGVLIDHFGWRSVFWINVPIAALVIFFTWRCIDETRDDEQRGKPLDIIGAVAITVSLGALTYAMLSGHQLRWLAPSVAGAFVLFAVALIVFIYVETRSANPLLPPALFRNRTFTALNVATFLLYGALGANFYEMPLVLIQGHGYSATMAAVATLPLVICMVALARYGTALRDRFGTRIVLTAGHAVAAGGFAVLAWLEPGDGTYWQTFFPGIVGVGLGLGLTVAPLTASVIDSAGARHVGAASGVNTAISRIAGLIAIAALTVVVWNTFNASLDRELAARHFSPATATQVNDQRNRLGAAHVSNARAQRALVDAFRESYRYVALSCAVLAALAVLTDAFGLERGGSEIAARQPNRDQRNA